jgi:hypothetical protein
MWQQNNVWDEAPFNGSDRNNHAEPRTNGEDPWMDMDGGLSRPSAYFNSYTVR